MLITYIYIFPLSFKPVPGMEKLHTMENGVAIIQYHISKAALLLTNLLLCIKKK